MIVFILNMNPCVILNISNIIIVIMLNFSPSNHPFLFDFFPFMYPVTNDDSNRIMN